MSRPSSILPLPSVQTAQTLAKHCNALGAIGVLLGPNGVGKSEAMKALTRNPDLLPAGRTAHYFLAAQAVGPSRGVRDMLVDMEVRQAIHQRGMALPIALKLAHRELTDRKIDLLLIDEGDLMAIDSIQGIISMYDYCRHRGHRLAMILGGSKSTDKWIGGVSSAWSRTLKVCRVNNLSPEMTCAVFNGWGTPMMELSKLVKERDPSATLVLKTIHKGTGGNLRRLYYFSEMAALDPRPLDGKRVRELMEQMTTLHVETE